MWVWPPSETKRREGGGTRCHHACSQPDQTTAINNADSLEGKCSLLKRHSVPWRRVQPEPQGRVGVVGPTRSSHGKVPLCPEGSCGHPQLRTVTLGVGGDTRPGLKGNF